jgi:uncharacterized protein (DUF885 family)
VHRFRRILPSVVTLATLAPLTLAACSAPPAQPPAAPAADPQAKALADTFVSAYLDRYPEVATTFGVPGRHHDRLQDNTLDALKAWEQKEDGWLTDARAIDPAKIQSGPIRAAYAIAREALESDIGARVCRNELWNVSQMTGWQVTLGYLVTIQPVGTDEARTEALARWSRLPAYLDTEIANLREGMRLGYTAPKGIVRIVLDQVDTLAATSLADTPFMSPAQRDKTPAFAKAFGELVASKLVPAFRRYRDFLKNEYLPAAREAIAVSANPDGAACYAASVRYFSSLPLDAAAVHETGLREIDAITAEMKTIAEQSFHTSDVPAMLQKFRTDRQYMFKDRADLLAYTNAALARAKAAMPDWFGLRPKADVNIEPYPKFREKNAPNEYNPPAEDGSRGGLFYVSAYQAEQKSKAPQESTTFHETIPGHHMQMSIALEQKNIHPIGRYIYNSGYVEGWGLYAERLADEMKLYSSDLDRMGMLSSQAFRAARLVIDSGIHTMGWTRQQSIDYMLAHTAEARDDIASEIDRYIIYPGQATAYMLGELEIRKARDAAKQTMGGKFDIKAFHDRVLEDGGVPLTFLSAKINAWAAQAK